MLTRVGLELELLAPRNRTRFTFARALARAVRGRVEFGFKYFSEGALPDGRPLCRLSSAARVRDSRGRVLVTLVDDNTIRDRLPQRPAARTLHATDDVRLALLAERTCWASRLDARLASLAQWFDGVVEGGTLCDAFGHPLVVTLSEPRAWHRVCEVVTRPLETRAERARVVKTVLTVAATEGFSIPSTAALHAHYDAAPWRSVRRLKALVLEHSAHRAAWWAALLPNRRCLKLAPFPEAVVRVAREAGPALSFHTFAAALELAGLNKACDLNLRGVVERHPRQRTLEVRCLPMSLDVQAVLASLETAEALLRRTRSASGR